MDNYSTDRIQESLHKRRETYEKDVLNSQSFKDGLLYLEGIGLDLLLAQQLVWLQGSRGSLSDHYLLLRFAPHIVESVIAITFNAREGLQNAARRELRFLLEVAIKLSSHDFHSEAANFEDRLAGLNDRNKLFKHYVSGLIYFDEFEKPEDTNAAILSLYSELSRYVHATGFQFQDALVRERREEPAGMESVATLNGFNKLAFQVYDIVLVRIFHSIGLGMAGDVFTVALDDKPKWRFHKGKFVSRLSKCFDYKHERKERRSEVYFPTKRVWE